MDLAVVRAVAMAVALLHEEEEEEALLEVKVVCCQGIPLAHCHTVNECPSMAAYSHNHVCDSILDFPLCALCA